jgi:hypothetical protein
VVAEPTLTSRALLPLVSGLRRLGHAPEPLLADVGVNPSALNDPDARYPMTDRIGLLARAFETTGDDCIGLHVAEHADFRSVDVHFYAMSASSTLRDASMRVRRIAWADRCERAMHAEFKEDRREAPTKARHDDWVPKVY